MENVKSVFVSYSREDISVVKTLESALVSNGISVWRDQEGICTGQQWPKAIGQLS